jgi:hypothetical protein
MPIGRPLVISLALWILVICGVLLVFEIDLSIRVLCVLGRGCGGSQQLRDAGGVFIDVEFGRRSEE